MCVRCLISERISFNGSVWNPDCISVTCYITETVSGISSFGVTISTQTPRQLVWSYSPPGASKWPLLSGLCRKYGPPNQLCKACRFTKSARTLWGASAVVNPEQGLSWHGACSGSQIKCHHARTSLSPRTAANLGTAAGQSHVTDIWLKPAMLHSLQTLHQTSLAL